jgi:cytochrome b561
MRRTGNIWDHREIGISVTVLLLYRTACRLVESNDWQGSAQVGSQADASTKTP